MDLKREIKETTLPKCGIGTALCHSNSCAPGKKQRIFTVLEDKDPFLEIEKGGKEEVLEGENFPRDRGEYVETRGSSSNYGTNLLTGDHNTTDGEEKHTFAQ